MSVFGLCIKEKLRAQGHRVVIIDLKDGDYLADLGDPKARKATITKVSTEVPVIDGLITYDNRHGWRGPEQRHPPLEGESEEPLTARWQAALRAMPVVADLLPAIVTSVDPDGIDLLVRGGERSRLSWQDDLRVLFNLAILSYNRPIYGCHLFERCSRRFRNVDVFDINTKCA